MIFVKWKIGNVEIDNQIALAPMAGVCDFSFRTIVKSMGCGLIETEMVSDKAIMYGNWKTKEKLYMTDYERPISQQIVGSDIESLTFASKYIYENTNADIIDINMGCPVVKVTNRSKSGCALMKDPIKVRSIVESIVDIIPIPVTVKIRSGWNENNAVEIAKIAEDSGASAIAVHPRTRQQRYDIPAPFFIWHIVHKGFIHAGKSCICVHPVLLLLFPIFSFACYNTTFILTSFFQFVCNILDLYVYPAFSRVQFLDIPIMKIYLLDLGLH